MSKMEEKDNKNSGKEKIAFKKRKPQKTSAKNRVKKR